MPRLGFEDKNLRRVISIYIKKGDPNFDTIHQYCNVARGIHNNYIYKCKNSKPSNEILYENYKKGSLNLLLESGLINDFDIKKIISYHDFLDKKKLEVESKGEIWKDLIPNYNLFDIKPIKEVHIATRGKHFGEEINNGYYNYAINDNNYNNPELNITKYAPGAIVNGTIRQTESEIKSYLKATKAYFSNKGNFTGRPRAPGYVNGYPAEVSLPSNGARIKDNKVIISGIIDKINHKRLSGFELEIPSESHIENYKSKSKKGLKIIKNPNGIILNRIRVQGTRVINNLFNSEDLLQIRFIPQGGKSRDKQKAEIIKIEFVYAKDKNNIHLDSNRILSIDPGYKSLFTFVTNDIKLKPVCLVGEQLKEKNMYYYEKIDTLKSIAKKVNNSNSTKQIRELEFKRKVFVENQCHLYAKYIIKYCINHNIGTIIIGDNKGQKQEANMGTEFNRKFYAIPFYFIKKKIEDLCIENNINYIPTEEAYTTKASFVDLDELHEYSKDNENTYKFSGKIDLKIGYYITKGGLRVHRDVNGAFNIMRKVYPKFYLESGIQKWIQVALSPPEKLLIKDILNYLQ
jgi:putative transposase